MNFVAPCGHPGRPIIGTYVECSLRCDRPQAAARRGEPGHVDQCACERCTIRRRVTHIRLRSKKGAEVILSWNGVDEEITWENKVTDNYRHWTMLDSEGAEVRTWSLDIPLSSGEAYLHPMLLLDVNSSLAIGQVERRSDAYKKAAEDWYAIRKDWGAELRATLDGGHGTQRGLEDALAEIFGVVGLHVADRADAPGHFDVYVDISGYAVSGMAVSEVKKVVEYNRPCGTTWTLWVNGAVWYDAP